MPSINKTYDNRGNEVQSKNALSTKITKVRLSNKSKRVMRTDAKIEKQTEILSQNCGNLQKNIQKNAMISKANKFKKMRGNK